MSSKQIDQGDSEPGPVNFWGVVGVAIQSTPTTVRLAVLLVILASPAILHLFL